MIISDNKQLGSNTRRQGGFRPRKKRRQSDSGPSGLISGLARRYPSTIPEGLDPLKVDACLLRWNVHTPMVIAKISLGTGLVHFSGRGPAFGSARLAAESLRITPQGHPADVGVSTDRASVAP